MSSTTVVSPTSASPADTTTSRPIVVTNPTSATASAPIARARAAGGWLALGAVVGSVLFELAWIVLGVFQPATMTPYGIAGGISGAISQPISGLGVGPNAALFNIAFVVCGLLQLVGVVGIFQSIPATRGFLARITSAVLLALSPVGLAMAGIFTLESLVLHLVAGVLVFVGPVLGFLAAGLFLRGVVPWRRFGTLLLFFATPLTLILWVVYAASFDQATTAAGFGIAGLTERAAIIEIHAWFFALGWLAFRRRSPGAGASRRGM